MLNTAERKKIIQHSVLYGRFIENLIGQNKGSNESAKKNNSIVGNWLYAADDNFRFLISVYFFYFVHSHGQKSPAGDDTDIELNKESNEPNVLSTNENIYTILDAFQEQYSHRGGFFFSSLF